MKELSSKVQKKYQTFSITSQHLGKVIRDNNITRKRTKYKHYTKNRHKNLTNLNEDLKRFYDGVRKYSRRCNNSIWRLGTKTTYEI